MTVELIVSVVFSAVAAVCAAVCLVVTLLKAKRAAGRGRLRLSMSRVRRAGSRRAYPGGWRAPRPPCSTLPVRGRWG